MKWDPWTISVIAAWIILIWLSSARIHYRHLRGNRLSSPWRVWWVLRRARLDPQAVLWGRRYLPGYVAVQHLLVAGTTGGGKTSLILDLLKHQFAGAMRSRFFIYDGKEEFFDTLAAIKRPEQRLITFDPFLEEGVRWDIAKDVVDDASANQVARILFPKGEHEHQPFFPESVQNLASGVMQAFIELGIRDWRLGHLIYILRSAERIQQVLNLTARGKDRIADFIHSGETWANIMATMSNRIQDYEIVAALWEHASTAFSLREWAKSDAILILRKKHTCEGVIDAMNRVLFAMAKRYLLSAPIPVPANERSWVILDELASIGGKAVSKELALLLEQGRSRNVCCLLGFQNIASLRDEFGVYGADRLIALCSTKGLLRFEDQASAEWAAGFFGMEEVRVTSVSSSGSSNGISSTTSYEDRQRPVVLPSEFQAIPRTGRDYGLTGYFVAPVGNPPLAYKDKIKPARRRRGPEQTPALPALRPQRPDDQQRLGITDADLQNLFQGRLASGASAPSADGKETTLQESGPTELSDGEPETELQPTDPALRNASRTGTRPAGNGPAEVWDLVTGVVEPAPSIWNVSRHD